MGLINSGKLEEYDIAPAGSLATVVESKSIYAKRYVNMVLGKVHMCKRVDELKQYPVSITPNCMRYQNHVASAIRPEIYTTPFIGKNAFKVQYEQALQYIHYISEEIEASRVTVYCENEAANLILSSFADRAKAQGIPLAVHAVLPNQLPLAESALCVLLSNALENAIHACSERADGIPGHIEVQTYEKAGKFFLQVVNDCTQPVQFSHGVPVSDRAGHGIGVHSICSIVERYGGVYSFSVRNQQFILRISL